MFYLCMDSIFYTKLLSEHNYFNKRVILQRVINSYCKCYSIMTYFQLLEQIFRQRVTSNMDPVLCLFSRNCIISPCLLVLHHREDLEKK